MFFFSSRVSVSEAGRDLFVGALTEEVDVMAEPPKLSKRAQME